MFKFSIAGRRLLTTIKPTGSVNIAISTPHAAKSLQIDPSTVDKSIAAATKRSQLVKSASKPKSIRRVGLDRLQRYRLSQQQQQQQQQHHHEQQQPQQISAKYAAAEPQVDLQPSMRCFAYCTARQFNLDQIANSLPRSQFLISCSPVDGSSKKSLNFVYARFLNNQSEECANNSSEDENGNTCTNTMNSSGSGEVFFFKDGCAVTWNTSSKQDADVLRYAQQAAVERFDEDLCDIEEMQFSYDPERHSGIYGEEIVLNGTGCSDDEDDSDSVYTKLAFSHGLARSTQLGVLEKYLACYLESIAQIPHYMMDGKQPPLSAQDVMRKHGQLLHIRGLLNLHTDLVDSEPDLYWTRADLAKYFDSVSRALDTYPRIRVLNQRLDYANQLVNLMRVNLSERHGTRMEWIIIALIAAEVGFEVLHYLNELHYIDLNAWIGNHGDPFLPFNNSRK